MPLDIMPDDGGVDLLYGEQGPTPKQALFRDDLALYKLFGGAVGGGKTWTLCAEGVRSLSSISRVTGDSCVGMRVQRSGNTTLTTLLKLIAEIERITHKKIMSNHHKTERIITFINGSVIVYGSLGDAQDFERIKSLEIGWFGIDEASETPFANYNMLKSRLRWKLPSGKYPPYFGLLASNPEPGWVKDTFVVPHQLGEPLEDHAFIKALPTDNFHLPPDYVPNLRKSNPESWVVRYLDGDWSAMEGQIWPEFAYDTHCIDPFDIPSGWKKIRSIDYGQVHPTACLWGAIDPDGNIFIYREYYSPGIVSRHTESIKAMSKGESYAYTVMDPSCWGKTKEKYGRLWSTYDDFVENGITCIKANNSVESGINRVGEFLKVKGDKPHPLTGQKGSSTLFIMRNCKNLILEIPQYTWKRETEGKEKLGKEAPKKMFDDACDALRYMIMSRPSPKHEEKHRTPYNSFKWHLKRRMAANYASGDFIGNA